jgi:hypothetical protein
LSRGDNPKEGSILWEPGKTYGWKRWDGTPKGYVGLLADGYMTLLAVLSR